MIEKITPLALKFSKFALVGMSGLIIDFAVTFVLKEKLKINKYIANSIGFVLAATNNYLFNRIWTFRNDHPDVPVQYVKFIAVSLIGLILNNAILKLLHDRLKLNFYIAKLIAIGIVLFWNFTANLFFTFNN